MEYIYENISTVNLEFVPLVEGQSLGEGVLSKVKGPSFFLDGYSRNGRFYPEALWDNALKNNETLTKLDRGLMFGCIGHPKDYTLDNLLESGKVSHKVTSIKIDKKTKEGIAEYEILDTPSGRILNTILKSGSQLYVSTRAFGGFTNETKTKDGKKYKILDDKNFVIESIDFVIEPGFLDTNPQLVESLQEDLLMLAEDEHKIVCEDGVCSLGEQMKKMNEAKELEGEEILKEEVVDKPVLDMDEILGLPKEDIAKMLENVVYENQLLSAKLDVAVVAEVKDVDKEEEQDKADDAKAEPNKDGELEIDSKMIRNYLSYLELLVKMVRYDTEYEKYYSDLIEIMDRDDKLTIDDMETLNGIIEEILKEEEIDESVEEICVKIQELHNKIIKNGEDNEDEKEEKDGTKTEPTKGDDKDEKPEESFIDFVMRISTKVEEKIVKEEDFEKVNFLKSQVLSMKEATISLSTKIEELESREPEVVEKIVTETEIKVPREVTEKIAELSGTIITLKEENTALVNQVKETGGKYYDIKENVDGITEAHETEMKTLKAQLVEVLKESDEAHAKVVDALSESNEELKSANENLISIHASTKEKMDKIVDKQEEVVKVNNQLKEEVFANKSMYLASLYKLDKTIVEKFMKMYSEDKELNKQLEKEQRISIREGRSKEPHQEVPRYTPKNESSKRGAFLDSLTQG